MAGNNGRRAQSSIPTIREELTTQTKLSPTIRSQSNYSYDEARAGYVERSYNAGGQWEGLARALSGFDKNLSAVLEHRMDKKIEEEVAAGRVLFAEDSDENKNKLGWKGFTEKNPQYQGDNPWLERGYEAARLGGLGFDLEKTLADDFVQSGMINEIDPKKVSAHVDEQIATFRKEQGLDAYPDKLFLAQNYTVMEAKVKQGLYAQHSQYVRAQQEERTSQQYTDLALKGVDALLDPARGGGNPADPYQSESIEQRINMTIAANTQEALSHGVRDTKGPEIMANMYLTAYHKTKNPAFLNAMQKAEINGGLLINQAGVAEKIESLEYQRIQRQKADNQYAWAVEAHNDRQEEKALLSKAWQYSLTGAPLTPDVIIQLGISERLKGTFIKQVGELYSGMQKVAQNSPAFLKKVADTTLRAKRGESTDAEVIALVSLGGEEGKAALNAHIEASKEENKLLASNMKDGGDKIFSLFSRTKDSFVLPGADITNLSQEQQDGGEARQVFSARYEIEYQRLSAENKGNVSAPQAESLRVKVLNDVTKEMSESFSRRDAIRNVVSTSSTAPLPSVTQEGQPINIAVPLASSHQKTPAATISKLEPQALQWLWDTFPKTKGFYKESTSPSAVEDYLRKFYPNSLPAFYKHQQGGNK